MFHQVALFIVQRLLSEIRAFPPGGYAATQMTAKDSVHSRLH